MKTIIPNRPLRRSALFIRARAGSFVLTTAFVALIAGCGGSDAPTDAPPPVTDQRPPALTLEPASLTFDAPFGSVIPSSRTVAITAAGDASVNDVTVTGVTYAAGQPQNWLRLQVLGSILPAQLLVTATVGALPAGVYTATIVMAASDASDRPQSIPVTFTVVAP